MTALNRSTCRRLKKLPQSASVWEGDRCSLRSPNAPETAEPSEIEDCVVWLDGTDAVVRAMDLVPSEAGPEVIVRVLMRAMESPHHPAKPSRPKKIVVRNRELQFYLRGVLQDLDIDVEYAPNLPLVDEILRGLGELVGNASPQLPERYELLLLDLAAQIWEDAPWQTLDEEKIIEVKVNLPDPITLYTSALGLEKMEYGILMYRSLESLKEFRQTVLSLEMDVESAEILEQAFLSQDCLFLTYDVPSDEMEPFPGVKVTVVSSSQAEPMFGNLHPLEGMRPTLYEEEALTVWLALSGLHRFFRHHLSKLSVDVFPKVTGRYQIADPTDETGPKIEVRVSTLPKVAEELAAMVDERVGDLSGVPMLKRDIMPPNAHYSLGMMPWEIVDLLRQAVPTYQASPVEIPERADGLPIVLIQTTRPKAATMISAITTHGLRGIGFGLGEDPFESHRYDLGILQTDDGALHLFGEFIEDDPVHIRARQKWDQRCEQTKGMCGLVIARGAQGASRGQPTFTDMMALFEVRSLSPEELGIGLLQRVPLVDLE